MEQRANIKFCFKLRKSAIETVELMRRVYGDQCLSRAQIFRWYSRFKTGVETIADEASSGRQISVRNDELIAKVRERILDDRCLTVRMMADEFDFSRETIRKILVKDLGKKKVASRFVPHYLSDDQKHARVEYAKDIIKTCHKNNNFFNSIVAEDETWCFRYDPTTKRQSAQWKSTSSPKGQKIRLQKSKVKTMLVCFYDSKGIIHKEFVLEGQTVAANFYLSLLKRLLKRILRVRPEYSAPACWSLLHDNAPAHREIAVQEFLPKKEVCVFN